MEKICFKDLSVANKIGLIGGWIAILSNVFYLIVGFIAGVMS